ncbi:MAG: hypothetical protein AAGF89_13025, partial [Bacteroidota bacterium]
SERSFSMRRSRHLERWSGRSTGSKNHLKKERSDHLLPPGYAWDEKRRPTAFLPYPAPTVRALHHFPSGTDHILNIF